MTSTTAQESVLTASNDILPVDTPEAISSPSLMKQPSANLSLATGQSANVRLIQTHLPVGGIKDTEVYPARVAVGIQGVLPDQIHRDRDTAVNEKFLVHSVFLAHTKSASAAPPISSQGK